MVESAVRARLPPTAPWPRGIQPQHGKSFRHPGLSYAKILEGGQQIEASLGSSVTYVRRAALGSTVPGTPLHPAGAGHGNETAAAGAGASRTRRPARPHFGSIKVVLHGIYDGGWANRFRPEADVTQLGPQDPLHARTLALGVSSGGKELMTIYGDESGWTGPDLLDSEQPVLAVSMFLLDSEQAGQINEQFFGAFADSELKFSALTRTDEGKAAIVAFLKWVIENPERQKSFVVHKRYALIGKLVDVVIESATYRAGNDLYREGTHIELMKSLHHLLPEVAGGTFSDDLLRRWQELARKPSRANLDAFYAIASRPPELEALPILRPIEWARERLGDEGLLGHIKQCDLDVLAAAVWALAFGWNKALEGQRIEVVFDGQSKLKTERKAWEVLMDGSLEVGPPVVARLPVVDSFTFADSERTAGIQLADVLAGSLRHVMTAYAMESQTRRAHLTPFGHQIAPLVAELPVDSIWPGAHHQQRDALKEPGASQRLIDATLRSVERRTKPKRRKP